MAQLSKVHQPILILLNTLDNKKSYSLFLLYMFNRQIVRGYQILLSLSDSLSLTLSLSILVLERGTHVRQHSNY